MSGSPVGTFVFIATRSLRNAILLRLKRLKEPRYLVGLVVAIAYFGFLFAPARGGRRAARATLEALPPGFLDVQLLAFALLLFAAFCLVWVFRWGPPALPLTEDEVQFLFPAPLSRRSLLHFSLLRPQLRLVFSAAVFTFALGRGSRSGWEFAFLFLGAWIVLTAVQLHLQAMAFWKASLGERRGLRPLAAVGLALLAAAGIAAAGAWVWTGVEALADLGAGKDLRGLTTAWEKLAPWRSEPFAAVLLFPFRRLLAPAFARDAVSFLRALPGAIALVALNYFWAAGATVSFEEATLDAARERARRRAARGPGRRAESLPSAGRRHVVPFRLAPAGMPEMAIVWKNLLSTGRVRLGSALLVLALIPAAAFAAPFLVSGRGSEWRHVLEVVGIVVPAVSGILSFSIPLGARQDLRRDLARADLLKLWPLDPVRLAAAELVVPLGITLAAVSTGFATGLALRAGAAAAGLGPGDGPSLALFAAGGSAFLLAAPSLVAALLVLQNGATLALPAWFPPGDERAAGLEAAGMRMLTFFATLLALSIAAIPAILLGGLVVWLGKGALGLLVWPAAALAASVPVWAEVWGGLHLLGALFRRFDPSVDLAP